MGGVGSGNGAGVVLGIYELGKNILSYTVINDGKDYHR